MFYRKKVLFFRNINGDVDFIKYYFKLIADDAPITPEVTRAVCDVTMLHTVYDIC